MVEGIPRCLISFALAGADLRFQTHPPAASEGTCFIDHAPHRWRASRRLRLQRQAAAMVSGICRLRARLSQGAGGDDAQRHLLCQPDRWQPHERRLTPPAAITSSAPSWAARAARPQPLLQAW